jgi:hypothetical protein
MITYLLVALVVILSVSLVFLVRSSKVDNLDEFIEQNYIVSDPGDEVDHIYNDKDGR